MKQLLTALLDGLTYKDLSGRRRLRSYTRITIAILALLVLVGGLALLKRSQMETMPRPVAVTVEAGTPTATPILESALVVAQSATIDTCPTNPEDWSLADVLISENYKVIQPACVYESLAKTVAWALAVRQGYSRNEATTALGFAEMPMRQLGQVTALTDSLGPLEFPVSFIPPHPDFKEWRVDAQGNPSVVYALRGCFRTSSVVGNRCEVWGGDYPVICVVVEDAEGISVLYSLDGHAYTAPAIPTRSFLLFGYLADGLWVWLGTQSDPKVEIVDLAKYANERLTVATLFDSQPWDAGWLKDRYGLSMRPLPENWRDMTNEADKQAILDGLNLYIGGK